MRTIGVALAILAAVLGLNVAVDPYGVFRFFERDGVNAYRPDESQFLRWSKALRIVIAEPEVLILGSSRAMGGLDPAHPGFGGRHTFNAGIPAATHCDLLAYFSHARRVAPVRQVVVGLDFFGSNAHLRQADCADSQALTFPLAVLLVQHLSGETARRSIRVLRGQSKRNPEQWQTREDGFGVVDPGYATAQGGMLRLFERTEKTYISEFWLPPPACRYDADRSRSGRDGSDDLRSLLRQAHDGNIDLRLLVSPPHSRLLLALDAAGLWPAYEEFLRTLVAVNSDEARRAGRAPFPLWDFAGFGPLQTRDPSPQGSTGDRGPYFDSSHYTPEIGSLMLDRVFGLGPGTFGVPINAETIDARIAKLRSDLERYRSDREELWTMYRRWAGAAAARSRCAAGGPRSPAQEKISMTSLTSEQGSR